jgi:hypothetical protein
MGVTGMVKKSFIPFMHDAFFGTFPTIFGDN